jgi:hypothetical protein
MMKFRKDNVQEEITQGIKKQEYFTNAEYTLEIECRS